MSDTPLDLDAILAAHASASPYGRTEVAGRFHASYYADDADVALVFASIPALIAALRKANAQVAAVLALCDEAAPRRMGDGYLSASVLAPEDVRAAVDAAGATQADDGAAVDAGPPAPVLTESAAAVPSSPDLRDSIDAEAQVRAMRFHDSACIWLPDLRERIAQRIDQAWAEANDRRPRSEYRDGYLDGLEHAEGIARSTPLTVGVAPLDVEAPQYDRIERDASRAAHAGVVVIRCPECDAGEPCQLVPYPYASARPETGDGAEDAPCPMRDEPAPSSDDPHGACSRNLVAVAVERDKARAALSAASEHHEDDLRRLLDCREVVRSLTAERDTARASRAALVADLRVVHQPEDVPESQHYYCDPDDCDRAGEGALVARCKVCETVYPCYTAAVIDRHAGAGS